MKNINFSKIVALVFCGISGFSICVGIDSFLLLVSSQASHQKLVWKMTAEDHYIKGLHNSGSPVGSSASIKNYNQAIKLKPDYAEAFFERGKSYHKLNSEDDSINRDFNSDAISDFNKAIKIKPRYAEAYFERARTYFSIGENLKAIDDLSKALKIAPNYAEAYYQRGKVYSQLQNKRAAVEDYIQVIKLEQESRAYRDDIKSEILNSGQLIEANLDFANIFYQLLANQFISDWRINIPFGDLDKLNLEVKDTIPNNADFYYFRSVYLTNYETRISDLTQAIKLKPDFPKAYYWRGIYHLGMNVNSSYHSAFNFNTSPSKISIAISDLTKAIEIDNRYADAYYVRGLANSRIGNEKEAISDFINALKNSPGSDPELSGEFVQFLEIPPINAETYSKRGFVRFNLGDFKGALEDYKRVIQLDQNFVEAYYYLGLIGRILPRYGDLYGAGRIQNKIADFSKALQINPRYINALIERSAAIYGRGAYELLENSLQDMTSAIELDPLIAEVYYSRGYFSNSNSNRRERIKDITQAIRINPNFTINYNRAGFSDCGGRGIVPNSTLFPEFNPDFSVGSHFVQTSALSGAIQQEIKRQKDAIKSHSDKIEVNPTNADAHYSRGYAQLHLGKLQNAIQDFSQAIHFNPQDASAYYRRGIAHHRQNNHQQAIVDYTQSIQLNTEFADAFFMRSLAHYDIGNVQEAFEDTNNAIRLDPTFPEAFFIRSLILSDAGYETVAQQDAGISDSHWPCLGMCCGGSSIQGNANTLFDRGRELARRGDKRGAIEKIGQAATLFLKQGNTSRYKQSTNLIKQLQQ